MGAADPQEVHVSNAGHNLKVSVVSLLSVYLLSPCVHCEWSSFGRVLDKYRVWEGTKCINIHVNVNEWHISQQQPLIFMEATCTKRNKFIQLINVL